MDSLINIFIADDHKVVVDGLVSMLAAEKDINIVGTAKDGRLLLEQIEQKKKVDLVIIDINMPYLDGIETTGVLKEKYPDLKIIILSMFNTTNHIKEALKKGVDGYLLKESDKYQLLKSIREVMAGGRAFPEEITTALINSFREEEEDKEGKEFVLTTRELEIIQKISEGLSSREIGVKLKIATNTVERHRKNIFSKLKVKNAAELMTYAFRNKLIK